MDNRQIKIDGVFDIKSRGIVIVIETDSEPLNLRVGDMVEILRPDGNPLITSIRGIDITRRQCFTESVIQMIGILLGATVSKADIPEGSILRLPVGTD
jgi:hypothetical protein